MKQSTFVSTARIALFTAVLVLLAGCNPLTKPRNTATVTFDESKVSCQVQNGPKIVSGTPVADNSVLVFRARPSVNKEVDTWTVNGSIQARGETYLCYFNLKAFNVGKNSTVTIAFTEKDAEKITVTFDASKIRCTKQEDGNTQLPSSDSGLAWNAGIELHFQAVPAADMTVDRWFVNGVEQANSGNQFRYVISKHDAKNKVIEITFTERAAEKITVTFDDTVLCSENDSHASRASGLEWEEGTILDFSPAKLDDGMKVDKWLGNGIAIWNLNNDNDVLKYRLAMRDAKKKGDKNIIHITFTVKPKEEKKFIVTFDGTKVQGNVRSNNIVSGKEHTVNTIIRFKAVNLAQQETVKYWTINGTEQKNDDAGSSFHYKVSEIDAKDGKIAIDYVVGEKKPEVSTEKKITVNFDSSKIRCAQKSGEEWSDGEEFIFYPKLPEGEVFEKWYINGKEKEAYDNDKRLSYRLNAEDAVLVGGKHVIEVIYTIYPKIKVTFTDKVKATKGGKEIGSGLLHTENTRIVFEAKDLEAGKTVDQWFVNGEYVDSYGTNVSVNIKNAKAKTVGSEKVIHVTYTVKAVSEEELTVTFDKAAMTCNKDWSGGEAVESGTKHNAGTLLVFTATLTGEEQVNHWYVNGVKKENATSGTFSYTVSREDVDNGGSELKITYTKK